MRLPSPRAALAALLLAAVLAVPAAALPSSSSPAARVSELLEAWDVEGAQELVRTLSASAPDDAGTRYLLGRLAFETGEYAEAMRHFEAAFGPRAKDTEDWALAEAAEKENRGTVVEESAHFTVRYRPGKDAALVPYAIEALEAAYTALAEDLGYAPPGKVRVEIYASPKALARVSSLSLEAIKATGTIALCKYHRLMITSPRALVYGYEWLDTLVHEYVHLVVTKKSGNKVPIWLHEGIAKFLENRWRSAVPEPLDPASDAFLQAAAKKDRLIPFAKMHPSIALLPTQEDAALAFAEVFTAVEMIHQRKGMAGLRTVIEALRDGRPDKVAVGQALNLSFEQFEAQWRKAVKARPLPPGAEAKVEKKVFRDERKPLATEDSREKSWERGELGTLPTQAAKHAHLGELLRARGRGAAAVVEFEKAIRLAGPTHPGLARKYALVQLDLDRAADAERVLRGSLAVHRGDATNNLLLGRVLVRTGRAAEARKHLEEANRQDPFNPEIHRLLVAAAEATRDEGLLAREKRVLEILEGRRSTWKAAPPGEAALAMGFLRIEAPAGARVIIDGVDTGLTTPVAEHPLPPGEHVVRLEPAEGPAIERKIQVGPDELVPFPQS